MGGRGRGLRVPREDRGTCEVGGPLSTCHPLVPGGAQGLNWHEADSREERTHIVTRGSPVGVRAGPGPGVWGRGLLGTR